MRFAVITLAAWLAIGCRDDRPARAEQRPAPSSATPIVVETEWLARHLSDDRVVVVHVGTREVYDREHVPTARYLDWKDTHVESDGLKVEMPPRDALVERFEALGISNRSHVVLYSESEHLVTTARVHVALASLGLGDRTSLLAGGLPRWKARNRPVTADAPEPARGSITPRAGEVLADRGAVARAVRARAGGHDAATPVVVDARDPVYFHGLGRGSYPRAGRIPGAVSVPYTSVVDGDGALRPEGELRELFEAAGVGPDDHVVTYCHIGMQASLVYLAARRVGLSARMYDGSFEDWSKQSTTEVVSGTPPRPISTAELADMLEREAPVVLDVRRALADYLVDHVPGAVWLHAETLRMTRDGVPAATHDGAHYAAIFGQLGVDLARPAVVYAAGVGDAVDATFAAWLLAGFGHRRVHVLDGGYAKWRAEARPVTRDYPDVSPTTLPASQFGPAVVATDMVHHLHEHDTVAVVDARPTAQYLGEAGPQMRRGHIPGAVSHPWVSDLGGEPSVWRAADELRARYRAQGITPDKTVVAYCNTGTEASHLYLTLTGVLEYPNVFVYVPSWTEWAAKPELPVATGSDAKAENPAL